MKIVVSNTSPIRYLVMIREHRLLPQIFTKIHIPQSVFQELTHLNTPNLVQDFMRSAPNWIEIHQVSIVDSTLHHLDIGEQEAIVLAESIHADLLIIDDKAGRLTAKERSLNITGTLGLLLLASKQQQIKLPQVLKKLLQTNIHVSPSLIDSILKKYHRKKI